VTGEEFERLWTLHRPSLGRRSRTLLPSVIEAEEAMGDLLVAALKARERLPSDGENGFQFRRWLNYMLKMEARTNFEQKRRGELFCVPFYFEGDGGQFEQQRGLTRLSWEQHDAEQGAIEDRIMADRILQVAASLKDRRAGYILLHQARGCTLEEIGQALGCTRENVRSLAVRAARLIREKMQAQGSLAD
jgi:RNA polymerase sigma factor (sigma-70 family)